MSGDTVRLHLSGHPDDFAVRVEAAPDGVTLPVAWRPPKTTPVNGVVSRPCPGCGWTTGLLFTAVTS